MDASEFSRAFVPHMDAAYNLARWLVRNDQDAQDVVQEAYLRALRFVRGFRGGEPRAWLLTIVRNTAYTHLARNRNTASHMPFDETEHAGESPAVEVQHMQRVDAAALRSAVEDLSPEFREIIVLRDLEGLSYKEIAAIADIPIGTVMSRLARARERLRRMLQSSEVKE